MKILLSFLFNIMILFSQTQFEQLDRLIEDGHFSDARQRIEFALKQPDLSPLDKWNLDFRADRMDRILKDFTKTEQEVLTYIQNYIPEADSSQMRKWEAEKCLEVKTIDGQKKYFSLAGRNLFRINKEAKARFDAKNGIEVDKLDSLLALELPAILRSKPGSVLTRPIDITFTYTLSVDKNAVPEGEIIRCWLPYPRDDRSRQKNVRLLSTSCPDYIIAPSDCMQRTLYMQKKAEKDVVTKFEFSVTYRAYSDVHNIDFNRIIDYDRSKPEIAPYIREEYPHIVFSETIKNLSKKIIGSETNKGKIIKLIYEWISNNIPWASAREYSTIPNIPDYCAINGHGDCGIKSLLFITLCRYNGIPAKWQSGWMFHPGSLNLHDWAELYVDGSGWVPVDQSFGLQESTNEAVKWFFLGSTDSYHFIVNDDISKPLFPEKIYPRSETVDFQRGEVEWKGGNLYFDKWDYHMDIKYSEAAE